MTRRLRRRFEEAAYAGVELEVNQRHVLRGGHGWRRLRDAIVAALQQAVATSPAPARRKRRAS